MANQAKTWETLCMLAAVELDHTKLREIITELEVRLEAREEELLRNRQRLDTFPTRRIFTH